MPLTALLVLALFVQSMRILAGVWIAFFVCLIPLLLAVGIAGFILSLTCVLATTAIRSVRKPRFDLALCTRLHGVVPSS